MHSDEASWNRNAQIALALGLAGLPLVFIFPFGVIPVSLIGIIIGARGRHGLQRHMLYTGIALCILQLVIFVGFIVEGLIHGTVR